MEPRRPCCCAFQPAFVVAVAAQRGSVTIGDFSAEALKDPAVRQIMAATKIVVDPEIDRTHGRFGNSPTTVNVKLKSGAQHFIRIDKPFGHPESPASLADGVQKLKACAAASMCPSPRSSSNWSGSS
ncbi:hypothetical protein [Mesorhizobium sp.]|uniref:hypothetical protein n=1 Tax=Mesorhizobium sp. TaxID=1871066 RepID=UPI0025EC5096|nr:hypothetical protein [Mesorhizobium sp.]